MPGINASRCPIREIERKLEAEERKRDRERGEESVSKSWKAWSETDARVSSCALLIAQFTFDIVEWENGTERKYTVRHKIRD